MPVEVEPLRTGVPLRGGFGGGEAPCAVCTRPIGPFRSLTPRRGGPAGGETLHPLCADPECRSAFDQGRHLSPGLFQEHLRWCARVRRERERKLRLQRARVEREGREAAAAFAHLLAREPQAPAPDLQLVTPSGHGPSARMSARRRRAHAAHLEAAIAEAFGAPPPPPDPQAVATAPEPAAGTAEYAGRLCGVCGGGCCGSGGVSAYITAATIRRVRSRRPELDPAGMLAAYMERVAERTVLDSCIHHTREGCSLPRELRSDTCNIFACGSLVRLQARAQAEPAPTRVVVLRRRQNLWRQDLEDRPNGVVGGAVLTAAGVTRVRLPRTAKAAAME